MEQAGGSVAPHSCMELAGGGGALGGDVLHYKEKCVRISFKTSGVDESRCPGWSPEEPQWRDRMGP